MYNNFLAQRILEQHPAESWMKVTSPSGFQFYVLPIDDKELGLDQRNCICGAEYNIADEDGKMPVALSCGHLSCLTCAIDQVESMNDPTMAWILDYSPQTCVECQPHYDFNLSDVQSTVGPDQFANPFHSDALPGLLNGSPAYTAENTGFTNPNTAEPTGKSSLEFSEADSIQNSVLSQYTEQEIEAAHALIMMKNSKPVAATTSPEAADTGRKLRSGKVVKRGK